MTQNILEMLAALPLVASGRPFIFSSSSSEVRFLYSGSEISCMWAHLFFLAKHCKWCILEPVISSSTQ